MGYFFKSKNASYLPKHLVKIFISHIISLDLKLLNSVTVSCRAQNIQVYTFQNMHRFKKTHIDLLRWFILLQMPSEIEHLPKFRQGRPSFATTVKYSGPNGGSFDLASFWKWISVNIRILSCFMTSCFLYCFSI